MNLNKTILSYDLDSKADYMIKQYFRNLWTTNSYNKKYCNYEQGDYLERENQNQQQFYKICRWQLQLSDWNDKRSQDVLPQLCRVEWFL